MQSYHGKRTTSAGGVGNGESGRAASTAARTPYPGNIGVLDLLYFWFAPTLCYQPDYPKSEKVCACV